MVGGASKEDWDPEFFLDKVLSGGIIRTLISARMLCL